MIVEVAGVSIDRITSVIEEVAGSKSTDSMDVEMWVEVGGVVGSRRRPPSKSKPEGS